MVHRDWQPLFQPASLDGEWSELAAARTIVTKLRPHALLRGGNYLRASAPAPFSELYFGYAATAVAHAWQFTSPALMPWDVGNAAQPLDDANNLVQSEELAFAFDKSLALVYAAKLPAGERVRFARDLGDDVISFWKASTDPLDAAASTAKTAGYMALPGCAFLLDLIETAP